MRKAFRRSLENKNSTLFIIFLNDEKFAGEASPDRLLFERSYLVFKYLNLKLYMSKQLKLKIVTPEKLVFEEMVDQVTLPTTDGEITVLPEHIPLSKGDVVGCVNTECIPMAVVGGFVEVKTSAEGVTEVAVLADFAEHVSEITDEKIAKAQAKAEEMRKMMEHKDHVDFEHFESELERSLTRIQIADKWRTRKYRK